MLALILNSLTMVLHYHSTNKFYRTVLHASKCRINSKYPPPLPLLVPVHLILTETGPSLVKRKIYPMHSVCPVKGFLPMQTLQEAYYFDGNQEGYRRGKTMILFHLHTSSWREEWVTLCKNRGWARHHPSWNFLCMIRFHYWGVMAKCSPALPVSLHLFILEAPCLSMFIAAEEP